MRTTVTLDDDVHEMASGHAVGIDGDDGVGLDVVDVVADERHVVAGERAQPAAVVLQRALARCRIVGDHLGEQLRIVADLARDPVREHLPGHVVAFAHRAVLVRPGAIDTCGFEAAVAARPEQ